MTLENITLSFFAYAARFSGIYSIISFLNQVTGSIFLVLSVYISNFHTEINYEKGKRLIFDNRVYIYSNDFGTHITGGFSDDIRKRAVANCL